MSFARYPAYKDSGVDWLGEVPAHWEVHRLKRSAQLLTEKTDRRTNPVALENIESWSGRFVPTDTEFAGDGVAFQHGDILFGKLRPYLAKALLAQNEGEAVGDFHVMRPQEGAIPRFLQYQLLEQAFIDIVDGSTFGSKMPRASWEFVGTMPLPAPPPSEQTAIATFLDRETAKIDALVAEQERLIALLKEKRQAVISHAVTKGLDPSVPMKDSGVEWLGEVPAHWEVRPIRRASTFVTSGPRGWSDFISEEGTLFVQSGDLDDEQNVLWQSAKRVNLNQADLAEAARTRLLEGDVVVCITGAKTGNVAIVRDVTEPAHINQHLCLIRPTAEVRAAFMGRYLASETGQRFLLLAQYGLKQGLGLDDIKSVSMPVPPVDEQDEIALTIDHLSGQMNQLMSHAQTVIATLQERRSALISAAVTGQIDVRGAPEQAP